jgi:hypothetical protein
MSGPKSGGKSGRSDSRKQNAGHFAKGGDARQGRGPAKGAPNAGRPPDKFKLAMQGIADRPEVLKRLTHLTGPRRTGSAAVPDDVFLKAFKEVADRGYGKPAQPIEHTGADGGAIQFEDAASARAAIARELAGVQTRGRAPADS